jgi:hypothetical protein
MGEYFLRKRKELISFLRLRNLRSRFKGVGTTKHNILLGFILILCVRLFFSVLFGENVNAGYEEISREPGSETIAPAIRIEKTMPILGEEKKPIKICQEKAFEKKEDKKDKGAYRNGLSENRLSDLVDGHPIEKMVSVIAKKDKTVAAFLVGIAKKESDWGKHSPKKDGKDCFNYWGYRGSYNPTLSGYSCFDSPEQAVDQVGGRIEDLVDKKIDTPEKMLVWKCGRSCAEHNPTDVRKWVSDVSLYFYKLNS